VYCRFCTRSYSIGNETETVKKMRFLPTIKRWEPRFEYIAANPHLVDIVLSGGDSYLLDPEQVSYLGERLLSIPHIRRIRFATKGLAVSPSRMLDPTDKWMETVISLAKRARRMGKHVCIHTHFNTRQEITWVTRMGAERLYQECVTVRNQTVLLHGVNNNIKDLSDLVHGLSEINIEPVSVLSLSSSSH
jgi:lysine 2,3-aminomutase